MLPIEHYSFVPLAELTSAQKPGPLEVYQDYWWAVDANDNALFYEGGRKRKSHSPQCNQNKLVVERHLSGHAAKVVFVPWAYVQFNYNDLFD